MNDLRKLVRYFRPYRFSLAIAISCIMAGVIFNVSIPLVVGNTFDAKWAEVTWTKLTVAALKVLGLGAMGSLFLFCSAVLSIASRAISNTTCGRTFMPIWSISHCRFSRSIAPAI